MSEPDVPPGFFLEPLRAEQNLLQLHETFIRSGSRYPVSAFSETLRHGLEASPDPDMALTNLVRFVGATASGASLFNDLLQYPRYCDLLLRVFGFSRYFADVLVREPGLFRWLTGAEVLTTLLTPAYLAGEVDRVLATFLKADKRLDALKRLHRRELLRIGAQDVLGIGGLPEVTHQLCVLADAVIDATLRIAEGQLGEKYGPPPRIPFCVIGLGKLGGDELNYSSDIDIIAVYRDECDAEGGAFFNRLSERLVQNLSQPSAEGHLYRVDMRLRPESGAGPLAGSLPHYLAYYESRGELWERQMLIKARPVAGDREFGAEVVRQLQPFVYPRTIFENPARSVARIKSRIESAVGDEANIKLMAGGIRDIEFIVQTLQLVNGGTNPALREPNTLRALAVLQHSGLLSSAELETLSRAYVLYRTIEHRLQTMLNTRTHTLPDAGQAFESLARRVGMSAGGELRKALEENLLAVRGIFDQVLSPGDAGSSPGIVAVIDGGLDGASASRTLGQFGFREPRNAARNVKILSLGSTPEGTPLLDTRSRDALRSVASPLFDAIARTSDPDLTLGSFVVLATGQKIPSMLYDQLSDARFRKFILDICAVSPRFARGLAQHPLLLETLASEPDALSGSAAEVMPPAGGLPAFKLQQELRAGVRHVLGFSGFDQLTEEISAVASFIVASAQHAVLGGGRRLRLPLALFALGKFGTCELGFDGDLDLLFLAGDPGEAKRPALEDAAARVLRSITAGPAGERLYRADVRLRPEGKNAPLVSDAAAYAKYLKTRASLWERQSLTRLRFVAGDPAIGAYVDAMVNPWVYESPLPDGWGGQIVAMRRAMETRSRTRDGSFLDLKLGPGGMVDVEFALQMVQMKQGGETPALRGKAVGTLLRMPALKAAAAGDWELFASAYAMYRRLELLMRIALEDRGWVLPDGGKMDRLARLYDGSSGEALRARVATTMKRVRQEFLEIVARLSSPALRTPP